MYGTPLLVAGLLLFSSFTSAIINLELKIPKSTRPHGPFEVAYCDSDTRKVEVVHFPGTIKNTRKRTYGYPPQIQRRGVNPKLLDLLRKEHQEEFCKLYIEVGVDTSPVVTETVTSKTCGEKNPSCTPITETKYVGVTEFKTDVVTAGATIVTVGGVVTSTSTVHPTTVITSTVGTPLNPTPAPKKRATPEIPPMLKQYQPGEIKEACIALLIELDILHPVKVTKTEVITTAASTTTITITTVAATVHTTHTVDSGTITHTNVASTTTITITGDPVTSTTTICPSATPYSYAIGQAGGHMVNHNTSNPVECCSSCYDGKLSCWGWAWWGPTVNDGNCVLVAGSDVGTTTSECPHGKGEFFMLTNETDVGLKENVGGAGPCWSGKPW